MEESVAATLPEPSEPRLVGPFVTYALVWVAVLLLYLLRLSHWLTQPTAAVIRFVAFLISTFALGYFLFYAAALLQYGGGYSLIGDRSPLRKRLRFSPCWDLDGTAQWRVLRRIFVAWVVLVAVEFIVEQRVPAVSYLVSGNGDYRNFGIPSLHGALLALGLAIGLVAILLAMCIDQRRFYSFTLLVGAYGVLIINRKLLVLLALASLALAILFSGVRLKTLWYGALGAVALVSLFGYLGDVRTTRGLVERAELRMDYPTPLPSGPVWVYMYATTPLENAVNLITSHPPEGALGARTFEGLIPTALVRAGDDNSTSAVNASRYWLTTSAFNVSTGYEAPYRDGGWMFIAVVNVLLGGLTAYVAYFRSTLTWVPMLAILYLLGILSVFSNNLGNLNVMAAVPASLLLGSACGLSAVGVRASSVREVGSRHGDDQATMVAALP